MLKLCKKKNKQSDLRGIASIELRPRCIAHGADDRDTVSAERSKAAAMVYNP